MGMVAILVMWLKLFEQTYVSPSQQHSTWNLASIGQAVIEENKFKNIDSERFGTRSMNDIYLWYS